MHRRWLPKVLRGEIPNDLPFVSGSHGSGTIRLGGQHRIPIWGSGSSDGSDGRPTGLSRGDWECAKQLEKMSEKTAIQPSLSTARAALLALGFAGVNALEPIHLDDAAYFLFAQHIAQAPLDPDGSWLFGKYVPTTATAVQMTKTGMTMCTATDT